MDNNKTNQVANQTEVPVSTKSPVHSPLANKKVMLVAVTAVILIGFTALLYFILQPKGSNQDKALSLLSQADTAFKKGDLDGALKLYNEANELDPNDPRIQSALIQVIASSGNQSGEESKALEKAQPYIDRALETNSNTPVVLISVGYAYETAGQYEKALEYYEKALKLNPQSGDAWFHKGHVLDFLGKTAEAESAYDKGYQLDPRNVLVISARANRLFSQGNYQESYILFKKASETPGINAQVKAEALTGASLARGLQEDFRYIEDALTLSKAAVAADKTFAPALSAHGYNLFMTGQQDEGLKYLKMATVENPRITKNFYLLAMFARSKKDMANAINYYKQAISGVQDDNTLVSISDKNFARGKYTYELAKAYSISGLSVNIIPLLNEAFILNPALRSMLRTDFERNGFFGTYSDNPEFQALIAQT